jgi:hypothetical protein
MAVVVLLLDPLSNWEYVQVTPGSVRIPEINLIFSSSRQSPPGKIEARESQVSKI